MLSSQQNSNSILLHQANLLDNVHPRSLQVCLNVHVDKQGTIMIPQDIINYLQEMARNRGLVPVSKEEEADLQQLKRNNEDDDNNLRLYKKEDDGYMRNRATGAASKGQIRLYKRGIRLYKKRGIRLY